MGFKSDGTDKLSGVSKKVSTSCRGQRNHFLKRESSVVRVVYTAGNGMPLFESIMQTTMVAGVERLVVGSFSISHFWIRNSRSVRSFLFAV